MITIDENNLKGLIATMKGIAPANYEAMDRIVACVSYLEGLLEKAKKQEEGNGNGG